MGDELKLIWHSPRCHCISSRLHECDDAVPYALHCLWCLTMVDASQYEMKVWRMSILMSGSSGSLNRVVWWHVDFTEYIGQPAKVHTIFMSTWPVILIINQNSSPGWLGLEFEDKYDKILILTANDAGPQLVKETNFEGGSSLWDAQSDGWDEEFPIARCL